MDTDAARAKIIDRLKEVSAYGAEVHITDETEIYYDLRLYGDDIYEFIVWVAKEFGVNFRLDFDEYSPRERILPILFRKWREREHARHRYKSLKVRDILTAIELGRWPIDRQ